MNASTIINGHVNNVMCSVTKVTLFQSTPTTGPGLEFRNYTFLAVTSTKSILKSAVLLIRKFVSENGNLKYRLFSKISGTFLGPLSNRHERRLKSSDFHGIADTWHKIFENCNLIWATVYECGNTLNMASPSSLVLLQKYNYETMCKSF